jgi:hypothetical protein
MSAWDFQQLCMAGGGECFVTGNVASIPNGLFRRGFWVKLLPLDSSVLGAERGKWTPTEKHNRHPFEADLV